MGFLKGFIDWVRFLRERKKCNHKLRKLFNEGGIWIYHCRSCNGYFTDTEVYNKHLHCIKDGE